MARMNRIGWLGDMLLKACLCAVLAGLFVLPVFSEAVADTVYPYTGYAITQKTDGTADVSVSGAMDDAMLEEMTTNLGGYTLDTIYILEGGVYEAAGQSKAVTIENHGTISDGYFPNTKICNYGLIDDASVFDVYNASSGQIIGYRYKDDGDYYYSLYISGAIENYGTIKCCYGTSASVTVNEGTIWAEVTYNAGWDYDEGYYMEVESENLGLYGQRVIDALGEGWYNADGTSADNVVLGLDNKLYKQWTKSDGVMTVEAYQTTSSKPVIITNDMLTDVDKIVVTMGDIRGENITVPVELSWRTCSSGECYYTSAICGGSYQDVTVNRTAEISGCTINGTLTLNKGCLIAEDVVLGSGASCIVNSLSTDTNWWKPSGFPYTYYLPMTITEGSRVNVTSTFYGDVTNYGYLMCGGYYGDVINYGTVDRSGCSIKGGFRDYASHRHSVGNNGVTLDFTPWDGTTGLSLTSGDNCISLACDMTRSQGLTVSGGQHLYLCLNGFDYTMSGSGTIITVEPYGQLTLCNCINTDTGHLTHTEGVSGRGVYVDTNATFTMYGGVINGNTYYSDGVGVRVAGTFVMHGGSIYDNDDGGENWVHGAGVTADMSPANFTMYGGTISGNTAERGGGVRISNGAAFTMYGGSITGNTANDLGGGLYVTGTSAINLLGGTISKNTAANEGGGIKNGTTNAVFTLGGSMKITDNTLTDGTVSNFDLYSSPFQLNSNFTGSVGVTKTYAPAAGSYNGFGKMADGSAVPAEMLPCFFSDNEAYHVYLSENGWAVLGHDTYKLTLTDATLADGATSITAAPGTQVTITAIAAPEGKIFTGWKRASGTAITTTEPTFTFTLPPLDVTISAVFTDEFVITDGVLTTYNGTDAEVIIPDDVTSIGDGVFAAASLTSAYIPDSVTGIGASAFPAGTLLISSYDSCARTWAESNGCTWQHDVHTEATIPGLEASCTEEGMTDYIFCEVCGDVMQDSEIIPALGHAEVVTVERVEPTCTEDGRTEGTGCSVCGATLVASEVIPANGHTPAPGIGKAPTCTEEGLTEGSFCDVCGETLTAQEAIPAAGHSPVPGTGVDPTCTEEGLTAGSLCGVCTVTLEPQETIPALGHDEVMVPGYAQTDRDAGLSDGVMCGRCGLTLTEQTVIPANFTYDGTTVTAYNGTATDVVIPSDATALSSTLFKNNTAITSVMVPDSVTSIGVQTFFSCTGLTDVYLPDGLTSITAQTFYKVTARFHVSADSATAIALSHRGIAFTGEDGLSMRYRVTTATGTPTAVWIAGYSGDAADVVIPDALCEIPVTQILASAFANQTQLATITIPASVTSIESDAFAGCEETLLIRSSADAYARSWCEENGFSWEHDVHTPEIIPGVPATCTSTGWTEGSKCSGCDHIIVAVEVAPILPHEIVAELVPASSTADGKSLTTHCSNCAYIEMEGQTIDHTRIMQLPANLTEIGAEAFLGVNAQQISVPEGVTVLNEHAFADCEALLLVILPDSISLIADNAFEGSEQVTLYCSASQSYVQEWAADNGVACVVK